MLKYIVYPGFVISDDGDRHYISASQLMDLYNVNPNECRVLIWRRGVANTRGRNKEDLKNLISPYPRRDGKYHNYNRKYP